MKNTDYQLGFGQQEKILEPIGRQEKVSELKIPIQKLNEYQFYFPVLVSFFAAVFLALAILQKNNFLIAVAMGVVILVQWLVFQGFRKFQQERLNWTKQGSPNFLINELNVGIPRILIDQEYSHSAGPVEMMILPVADIVEWVVEQSFTDGPKVFTIILRDGKTVTVDRLPILAKEKSILDAVRHLGTIRIRLKENVG